MKLESTRNSFGLNEYKKVSLCSIPAFIPESLLNADDEMLNKLKAAVYSLFMGVSLSAAYKDAKGHRISDNVEVTLIQDAKSYCNQLLFETLHRMKNIKHDYTLQNALIGNTLARLEASYEAAIFLAYDGFNYETKAVARMILEQLSYIYQVSRVDTKNSREENILDFYDKNNIQNTNISGLKNYFPSLNLGLLYNDLTKHAHFDKNAQFNMLKFDRVKDETLIYLKSFHYSFDNFRIIIILLEITRILLEYSFRKFLTKFEYIDPASYELNKNHTIIQYPRINDLLNSIAAFDIK